MVRRQSLFGLLAFIVFAACGSVASASTAVLVSAISQMTHGNAGAFGVSLPLTGGSGIECRNVSNGMKIVATFDQAVTAGSATITGGTASIAGTPTFSGSTMTVNLTGITDAQTYSLTLTNIVNTSGQMLPSTVVPFRTLFGDINGDSNLNGSDVNICRAAVGAGAPINAGNFRCDVNLDGAFTGADVNQIRAAVGAGASVGGGATNNTPPTISTIANQSIVTGVLTTIGFTVGDAESDPGTLVVTVISSDQVTIPSSNIAVTGTTASRTLSITPAAGITTVTPVTISMYVSDGLAFSSTMTFTVNVTPPPMTYLATLTPVAGTGSLGSGTATLVLSGDLTSASIKYSYSNMSSNDIDDAIYIASATGAAYDISAVKNSGGQQPDGSYLWTFNVAKAPAILASIQGNTATILLDSANFPAGELTGTFKLVTGSQTFTAPAPPPQITINPPTAADASRFMQQAGFGGNSVEIATLSNPNASNASTAINDWLTAQFNMPGPIYPTYAATTIAPTTQPLTTQSASQPYTASSMYYQIYNRVTTAQSPNAYGDSLSDDRVHESWFKNAVTGPDELRQRVATALSEIFVVSEIDDTVDGNIPGLASYYDMLADDAFVNFRQLLGDVTLHPIMGNYLNMQGNLKTAPNENYAREVMQLFTIGLYMLQPDGTLMLDSNGQPIPTYTQPLVTSFAAVYTGWNTSAHVTIPTLIAPVAPATQPTVSNFTSYYQTPMVVTASNHSTSAKTLLSYPNAATYPAATQPSYIPATTSQTANTATAELNFALDNIFNHPNVGPFICKQLIQRLVESNPSPAYVYRVAQVFANDGTGVRGNMKAVITAILTDYEARSPAVRTNAGYGHMREPIIRFADILHSCNAVSKTGKWAFGKTDSTLSQTIFRSPTVFNFFSPTYSSPGPIQQAGLASPELQIIYETTISNAQNMIYTGIYAGYQSTTTGVPSLTGTGFRGDAYGSDIYLDFSSAGSNLVPLTTASGNSAMLNQVVLLLSGGPLDSTGAAQARIQTFLNTLPTTNPLAQVQAAVHLVATSSQCAAEK